MPLSSCLGITRISKWSHGSLISAERSQNRLVRKYVSSPILFSKHIILLKTLGFLISQTKKYFLGSHALGTHLLHLDIGVGSPTQGPFCGRCKDTFEKIIDAMFLKTLDAGENAIEQVSAVV